jgi:hypothetical protein
MTSNKMTEESREWLEAECLRCAKRVRGCEGLTGVVIMRSGPEKGAWRVDEFIPRLPYSEDAAARLAVTKKLAGKYLLMGQ